MSAQANIIAFDGATTPVSHTLIPLGVSIENGTSLAEWAERLASLPLNAQVSASQRKRVLKSGMVQESLTVTVPVMEAVAGNNAAGYTAAPQVAYPQTIVITQYSHPRSPVATRRLTRQLALNIAGSVTTSVVPVVTGPVPELFDQSIQAS